MPLDVEVTTEEALPGTMYPLEATLPPPVADINEADVEGRNDDITLLHVSYE